MYASFDDYAAMYGDVSESEYRMLSAQADRVLDAATTGIDGVKKLKVAYPIKEADIIIMCACKVAHALALLSSYENASGFATGEHGMQGKAVSSVSAGNESISYSAGDTAISKAAGDEEERRKYLAGIVKTCLTGVTDENGVNLLYMGVYPRGYNV